MSLKKDAPFCHGLSRFVTVCDGLSQFGLSRFVVCHGLSQCVTVWFVTVCHGVSGLVTACHGVSRFGLWFVTVCHGLSRFSLSRLSCHSFGVHMQVGSHSQFVSCMTMVSAPHCFLSVTVCGWVTSLSWSVMVCHGLSWFLLRSACHDGSPPH